MSRKVKLELVQPKIKCVGRKDVKCHYRGTVIFESEKGMVIRFRYRGQYVERLYGPNGFDDVELMDIKIVI